MQYSVTLHKFVTIKLITKKNKTMSRSNPNEDLKLQNPAAFFLEWKGKDGGFVYWDKKEKKNVDVPLPFTFIPLATLVTLKGYNQKKETSYWSNEVKDITKDKFIVKGKNNSTGSLDTHFEGLYKDLKEKLELNKINFTQSVYIAYKGKEGALELANIQIKTSALGPWIEFCKKNNINKVGVTVKSSTKEKNGDVSFLAPVYTPVKISEKSNAEAVELDKMLQVYLKEYLAQNKTTNEEKPAENTNETKKESANTMEVKADIQSNESAFLGADDDDQLPF